MMKHRVMKHRVMKHRGRFCVLTAPFSKARESPLSSETKSKDLVTRDKCLKKLKDKGLSLRQLSGSTGGRISIARKL